VAVSPELDKAHDFCVWLPDCSFFLFQPNYMARPPIPPHSDFSPSESMENVGWRGFLTRFSLQPSPAIERVFEADKTL